MGTQTNILSEWIDEYHNGVRYGLKGKVIAQETSQYQEIKIIDSDRYGKALLLDGCWMTAEYQEKHYHENLVHPALCGANSLTNILIIGGGDGGTAKECLRYDELENLDLVEIDERVIELSQHYLPQIGGSAWKDPRLRVHIGDGITWTSEVSNDLYDVILVDGSDPNGPAKGLFNKDFFQSCKRILKPNGIFATQSESPEAFCKIHIETIQIIREVFKYADPMYGCVPMYPSGWWSWIFACEEGQLYLHPKNQRARFIEKECSIWSPRWQEGAFKSIPNFIEREIQS